MHTYAVPVDCAKPCDSTAKCDEMNDTYLEKMILQDFLMNSYINGVEKKELWHI